MAPGIRGALAPRIVSTEDRQHRRASALEHLGAVASRIVSTEGPESRGTGDPWSFGTEDRQHRRASALEHLGAGVLRHQGALAPKSHRFEVPWFRSPAELRHRGTLESWRLVLFELVAVDDQLCKLRLQFAIVRMPAKKISRLADQFVERGQSGFNLLRGRHVSLQKILTDEKVRCEVIIRLRQIFRRRIDRHALDPRTTLAAGRTWTAPTPVTPSRIEKLNHRWWS